MTNGPIAKVCYFASGWERGDSAPQETREAEASRSQNSADFMTFAIGSSELIAKVRYSVSGWERGASFPQETREAEASRSQNSADFMTFVIGSSELIAKVMVYFQV